MNGPALQHPPSVMPSAGSGRMQFQTLSGWLLCGGVVSLLIAVVWFWNAWSQPGAPYRTEYLVTSRWNSMIASAGMERTENPDGTHQWRAEFALSGPTNAQPLALRLILDVQRPGLEPVYAGRRDAVTEILGATLTSQDAAIRWIPNLTPGPFRDQTLMEFRPELPKGVVTFPALQRLRLEIHSRGPETVSLWGQTVRVSKDSKPVLGCAELLVPPASMGPSNGTWASFLLGQWIFPLSHPPAPRAELLSAIWTFDGQRTVAGVLSAGLLAAAAGWILLVVASGSSRRGPLLTAVGTGLFLMGLSWLHSIVNPPLEAPDEPVHFLAFAHQNRLSELDQSALDLAHHSHLERLRYRAIEHFSADHVGRPLTVGWSQSISLAEDMRPRSPIAALGWSWIGPWVHGGDAAKTLLELRLCHGAILGLGAAIALGLLAQARLPGHLETAGLGWLCLPSLPFIGMHASNYVWIILAAFFGTAAITSALWAPSRKTSVAILFGLSLGGGIHVSRNALPLTLWFTSMLAPLMLGFQWPRGISNQQRFREAAIFWGVLGAAATVGSLPTNADYAGALARQLHLPAWLLGIPGGAVTALAVLTAVPVLLGFAWDLIRFPARDEAAIPGHSPFTRVIFRGSAVIGLSVCLFVLVAPLLFPWVELPTIQNRVVSIPTYLKESLAALITSLGIGGSDLYVGSSVVSGFGGPDTFLPWPAISVFGLFTCLGFGGLFLQVLRGDAQGISTRALWLGIGWLVAIALTAAGCLILNFNFYGRYLIGLFLGLVGPAMPGWLSPTASPTQRCFIRAGLLLSILVLQTYSLIFILKRYFG